MKLHEVYKESNKHFEKCRTDYPNANIRIMKENKISWIFKCKYSHIIYYKVKN